MDPNQSAPHPSSSGKLQVFVVDDEPDVRRLVSSVVEDAGCEAVLLEGGAECLSALQVQRPALIVMDLAMEPMGGEACCQEIRENRAWCDIPIVMSSTAGSTAEVMQAWRAGADDFLPKPIDRQQLEAKIDAVRDISRAIPIALHGDLRPLLLIAEGPFLRSRLGNMLECSGYRMLYAKSRGEALAVATEYAATLRGIVVDLALPSSHPLELLRALKDRCHAPLLALSQSDEAPEMVAAVARLTGIPVSDKRLPFELIVSRLNLTLRQSENLVVAARTPFFSLVDFRIDSTGSWSSGFSFDLSNNGIFITTLTPPPQGANIQMRVSFPGRDPMPCTGTVAWANELHRRRTFSYMVGMGARLTSFDDDFRSLLAQYTASLSWNGLSRQGPPQC